MFLAYLGVIQAQKCDSFEKKLEAETAQSRTYGMISIKLKVSQYHIRPLKGNNLAKRVEVELFSKIGENRDRFFIEVLGKLGNEVADFVT